MRVPAIVVLLTAYAVLTLLILLPDTFVQRFDSWWVGLDLTSRYPSWYNTIDYYVMFGQRGPATLLFLPFFVWVAWRQRTMRPLLMLGTALVSLNVTVGVVKYAIGRVGPHHSDKVHDLFVMGNSIYPSGHVSNTVVLYGVLAWITPVCRRAFIAAAAFLSVTVGFGTIYLRTHWFSDVVGGWIAGALVLLTLPYLMPTAQRWWDAGVRWVHGRWLRHRARRAATGTPGDELVPVRELADHEA